MLDTITQRLVQSLGKQAKAGEIAKPFEVRDRDLKGFILRVQPSGHLSYIVQLSRTRRITLGNAAILTPAQGRTKAKVALGAVADGRDPKAALAIDEGSTIPTLKDFIENTYSDWIKANRKTGAGLVARINACFLEDFGDTPLDQISAWNIEKWRKARLQQGRTPATVNRDLSALKAAFQRAIEWELIDRNPIAKVKPAKIDNAGVVRYLSTDEEQRLRQALVHRDQAMREARARGNSWRAERERDLMPEIGTFGDHLTPMVLLSINTGLRRGELFNLTWPDVDLERANLTVRGTGAKSGKTRHIPLNTEAVDVLKAWKAQTSDTGLVFVGRTGERFTHTKRAWAALLADAKIATFRWHDLRHHFASRLVMAGVDLNTVRELLGHSDLTMTLRYAHLAPEHKAAAVARLV
ncbi:MAG: site-specific integrase [Chromatiaceae bacterium]|nr:site-specific integrase [Chromatiaceae bacterium]MCF7996758.1 site-specific integrase [Chromatiaceae bacterium]MCF8004034.1 site-specific integrase [Chromatiaceae bacterium]MCF8014164.1 site-specific integrase [Chromatiaceae bacterium]